MDALPESMRGETVFGCYVEAYDPTTKRTLVRGVLPLYATADVGPELQAFALIEIDNVHVPPLAELN
jgi:hypothetical protein